jgi:hypothetical protein
MRDAARAGEEENGEKRHIFLKYDKLILNIHVNHHREAKASSNTGPGFYSTIVPFLGVFYR